MEFPFPPSSPAADLRSLLCSLVMVLFSYLGLLSFRYRLSVGTSEKIQLSSLIAALKSPETWLSLRPRCWGPHAANSLSGPAGDRAGDCVTNEQLPGLGVYTVTPNCVKDCSNWIRQPFKKYNNVGCFDRAVQSSFNVQLSSCTIHMSYREQSKTHF